MNRTCAGTAAVAATVIAAVATSLALSGYSQEAGRRDGAKTDAALIASAMSAAPAPVGRQATVIAFDEHGKERTLRRGSGEFTCLPDNPATPGDDPMCFDRNGFAWAHAWMAKQPPPSADQVGVAYMLRGSWAASNEDPHATAPGPGKRAVKTGPALMILNVHGLLAGHPRQASDPARPFVMWPDTPYEHLMVPVGAPAR